MNKTGIFYKKIFSVFGLLFYTNSLKFDSFFSAYDGTAGTYLIMRQPLGPILSLIQHGIFIVAVFFLLIEWENTIQALIKNFFLWILVSFVIISFLWSDFPYITFPRSLSLLETSLFGLYLASDYQLKTQIKLLAYAIGIAILLNIVFTIIQPNHAIDWIIHPGAWKGVFAQKNLLGRLVALGSITFLVIESKSTKTKYLLIFFLSLSIGLIVLSQSKSAMLIFLILTLILIILKFLSWSDIVFIPLILSIFLITSSFIVIMITNLENILLTFGRDPTLSGRTVIWSALFDKILEQPWLGYGYLGFWHGTDGDSSYVGKVIGTTYIPPHAHNGFLELLLSFGLIGFLLFILSFVFIIRRAIIATYFRRVTEELFPLLYLIFLLLYNMLEPTLIEHNSIFWVLYVSLASTKFLDFKVDDSTYMSSLTTKN